MSDELRFVNAIIGFCKRTGNWPAPLAPYGYIACGYDRELKTIMNGQDRTVPVDLLCASGLIHHALCVETKSRTLHEDQVHRYRAVNARNLLQLGGLPSSVDPQELTHDVVYVAQRANTGDLIRQFDAVNVTMPIVAGDEQLFDLVHGAIGQKDIHRLFANGVAVNADAWPTHFVAFNGRSPDAAIVPYVAIALAKFIMSGDSFSIEELLVQAVPHWSICGRGERQRLRTRTAKLVDRAGREEFEGYFDRPGKEQAWELKAHAQTHPSQRQKLYDLALRFVERVQKQITFVPGQLDFGPSFFDPLVEDEEELEEDDE